jgi:hypothetical protein
MIEAANQSVSGTSATADTRWAHQCATPDFAEPSPFARGVCMEQRAISLRYEKQAGDPGGCGESQA